MNEVATAPANEKLILTIPTWFDKEAYFSGLEDITERLQIRDDKGNFQSINSDTKLTSNATYRFTLENREIVTGTTNDTLEEPLFDEVITIFINSINLDALPLNDLDNLRGFVLALSRETKSIFHGDLFFNIIDNFSTQVQSSYREAKNRNGGTQLTAREILKTAKEKCLSTAGLSLQASKRPEPGEERPEDAAIRQLEEQGIIQ